MPRKGHFYFAETGARSAHRARSGFEGFGLQA